LSGKAISKILFFPFDARPSAEYMGGRSTVALVMARRSVFKSMATTSLSADCSHPLHKAAFKLLWIKAFCHRWRLFFP
jgi:hypothetical protein